MSKTVTVAAFHRSITLSMLDSMRDQITVGETVAILRELARSFEYDATQLEAVAKSQGGRLN